MPAVTRESPRGRVFMGIIGACLLVLLGVGAGASWRLEQRVRSVGAELIAQAQAFDEAHWPRPSHVDRPTPGTFGEALAPLMPELRRFHLSEPKLPPDVTERCKDVRQGTRPVSELPQPCRDLLESGRPLMERVLKAARAEQGGQPEGMRLFTSSKHPYYENKLALQSLMRSAALEIRLLEERGQTERAVETCLDGLALARDLSHGAGLIATMVSVAGYNILFYSCSAALRDAPPDVLPRTVSALRRIREGLSPFSATMRQESLQFPLTILGSLLEPEQRRQLPAAAREALEQELPWKPDSRIPLVTPILARDYLVQVFRHDQRLTALADLPPRVRRTRMDEVTQELRHSWNPLLSEMGTGTSMNTLALNVDRQRVRLDLLLALAWVREYRAEHGEWPSVLPSLYPERPVLLPTPLRLQPGPGGTLTLLPEEELLGELTGDLTPAELAQHPFEVTASP